MNGEKYVILTQSKENRSSYIISERAAFKVREVIRIKKSIT